MTAAPFDPNHAPDGYVAVLGEDAWCEDCAFEGANCWAWQDPPRCYPDSRPDRRHVIFIRRDSAPSGAQEDTQ